MTDKSLESTTSSTQVTIRQATSDDAEEASLVLQRSISELCQLDYNNTPGRLKSWLANKTPGQVREWLVQPGFIMLLAIDDGNIAGVGAMHEDGVVLLNYVDPDWRFKGISSAVLAVMEEKARGAKLSQLRLESTKTAERFYRERGYDDWANVKKSGLWLSKELSATNH